jgi:hypothetical protein
MGGAGGRRIKTPYGHKALSGGKNPVTEARRAGPTLRRRKKTPGQRYVGSSQPKRLRSFREGETSEG